MDFNKEVYIAGEHQKQRLKERTNEKNIYSVMNNWSAVLIRGNQKYFRHTSCVVPTVKDNGVNIIRTILDKDMYIYEDNRPLATC